MAHLELEDGIFIEYELSDLGGSKHCFKAELDCTFESVYQMADAAEKLRFIDLDDNESLKMHINNLIYKGKI